MTDFRKISAVLVSLLLFFIPIFTYSAPTLDTTAKKTGITYECQKTVNGQVLPGECDFNDVIAATQRVVKFGVTFALGFSVIVIAYAGFNYMISGDNPGKRKDANSMLFKVAIGIIFILIAWLIVTLILNALEVNNIVKLG